VPVVFLDNWKLFPDSVGRRFLVQPGLSRILVLKPIPTVGLTENEVSALEQKVFHLMEEKLIAYKVIPEKLPQ
jgi:hypothetical protein